MACKSGLICFLPVLGCLEFAEGREDMDWQLFETG
jgi:hypothetical protein